MAAKKKKLARSKKDKVLTGVLGGFGEYLGVNALLIRLAYIFVVLMTGIFPGIALYILAALLIPQKK